MSDSPILDGGKRFPEVMTIRLPEGFLGRIKDASEAEGISPRDFARRAIAERINRSDLGRASHRTAPAEGEPRPDTASPATTPSAAEAVTAPVVAPRAQPAQATAAEASARPASPRSRSAWTQP